METDFSSHSNNSIYCELLDGKLLSSATAAVTVPFNSCCVWLLIVFFECSCVHAFQWERTEKVKNEHVKNAEPFPIFVAHFVSSFFSRPKVLH